MLDILEEFGSVPGSLEARLQELDEETLKKWTKLAAKVDSMEEFLVQIK